MRPVAPRVGLPETTIAEGQHEYLELTGVVYRMAAPNSHEVGPITVLTRWRLTDEERKRIADGEDLYLHLLTFGQPLQPIVLEVGPPAWAVP